MANQTITIKHDVFLAAINDAYLFLPSSPSNSAICLTLTENKLRISSYQDSAYFSRDIVLPNIGKDFYKKSHVFLFDGKEILNGVKSLKSETINLSFDEGYFGISNHSGNIPLNLLDPDLHKNNHLNTFTELEPLDNYFKLNTKLLTSQYKISKPFIDKNPIRPSLLYSSINLEDRQYLCTTDAISMRIKYGDFVTGNIPDDINEINILNKEIDSLSRCISLSNHLNCNILGVLSKHLYMHDPIFNTTYIFKTSTNDFPKFISLAPPEDKGDLNMNMYFNPGRLLKQLKTFSSTLDKKNAAARFSFDGDSNLNVSTFDYRFPPENYIDNFNIKSDNTYFCNYNYSAPEQPIFFNIHRLIKVLTAVNKSSDILFVRQTKPESHIHFIPVDDSEWPLSGKSLDEFCIFMPMSDPKR